MNRHTPGPWRLGYSGNETRAVMSYQIPSKPVAYVVVPDRNPYYAAIDEADANGRLLAAAPDLATALLALVSLVEQALERGRIGHGTENDVIVAMAHKALARLAPAPSDATKGER